LFYSRFTVLRGGERVANCIPPKNKLGGITEKTHFFKKIGKKLKFLPLAADKYGAGVFSTSREIHRQL
jgi:hypothetical protein